MLRMLEISFESVMKVTDDFLYASWLETADVEFQTDDLQVMLWQENRNQAEQTYLHLRLMSSMISYLPPSFSFNSRIASNISA